MKKTVVVLGTGFGAYSMLHQIDAEYYNVKIVSPRNHFVFTPLLASTTVGTIEFRSVIEPIRNFKHFEYFQSYCTEINTAENKVICIDEDTKVSYEVQYDILIIAIGETNKTFNIPGVWEYAYFLKEVGDARKIRVRVIDCFENAMLPGISESERKKYTTFIVCGGGPTGVEFAAELYDFIEEDVHKKYPALADKTEVILIEAMGKILLSFDEKLSEYTMKLFKRQNIKLLTNTLIAEVKKDNVILKDGTVIPYGVLVWSTGNEAVKLVKDSKFEKTKNHKILTDKHFRVLNHDNVYAIGDCMQIKDEPYPATAQVAQQQGKYLGNELNRAAKGNKLKPFVFKNFGMLAYVGSGHALADMPKYKSSGFATYIFWRSVYLTRLVSIKNKMLVLFDWFKAFVFGRDVSNF